MRRAGRRWAALAAVMTAALAGVYALLAPGAALANPTEEEAGALQGDPDYANGRKAIEAKDWARAIRLLSSAALRDTRNADIQNHLGYAYRHTGQIDLAFEHYARALKLNPRHRGAHEYVGEAYLMVKNLAKAEEHLAMLEKICLSPCEELEDLEKKVAEYRLRNGK
jgi:Flp pilus assembly protein TadD